MTPLPPVNVVVAATVPDIQAVGIASAVAERRDMNLVGGRVLAIEETDALLESRALNGRCAIVLVGPDADTEAPAERFLAESPNYVVLRVSAPIGDLVRVAAHRAGMQELLAALHALVSQAGNQTRTRVALFRTEDTAPVGPLLNAAIGWIHETLRSAIAGLAHGKGDLVGLTVSAAALADSLAAARVDASGQAQPSLDQAREELNRALEADQGAEPLGRVARCLRLTDLEFRVLLLALAPELDARYQRCVGVLLDDLGRRVGTLGLYCALLGDPVDVRLALGDSANLARFRLFDTHSGALPPADEPLRLDPAVVGWLLGDGDALAHDARTRRAIRQAAWPGVMLIDVESERFRADTFVDALQGADDGQWLLFTGNDPAGWRALLELGCMLRQATPIRVDAARIAALDVAEVEEYGIRFGRAARLTDCPLLIDLSGAAASADVDQALRPFFNGIADSHCRVGVICPDGARVVRLLGPVPVSLLDGPALGAATRTDAFMAAAKNCGARMNADQARLLVTRHPLHIDGIEQAMTVARGVQPAGEHADAAVDRFLGACKQVSSENLSELAQRIEPVFSLEDVVLPKDRHQQLQEIVDNVRFADKVLDGWKFGDQLPYGRGVTALLHGPSGTGKTMAALAIAKRLGVQILRIDLSRVVSKYIGDTEKNIRRMFDEAGECGAALLIDEADALLGKRSEVKDAHDRYANIEVAYLLQRMEAYEGLAIMTTNLRQNLDASFLRRLRFIIDFPRPDVPAREEIWRRCLPEKSHTLDDAAFRQLARQVDLTGGHIRQITLRAAFVAAAAGKSIDLTHLAYAVNAELEKLGRSAVTLTQPGKKAAA